MRRPGFTAKLTFLCGGLLIWAAHFLTIYGVNGVVCARGLDRFTVLGFGIVPAIVAAATGLAVIACCMIAVAALRGQGPGMGDEVGSVRAFWRSGTACLAGFAVIAILWTGLPALLVAPCA
jgi:hypothetical protein